MDLLELLANRLSGGNRVRVALLAYNNSGRRLAIQSRVDALLLGSIFNGCHVSQSHDLRIASKCAKRDLRDLLRIREEPVCLDCVFGLPLLANSSGQTDVLLFDTLAH